MSIVIIAGTIGAITWLLVERTVPRMLANANEEMVADWKAGLTLRYQETGTWPRQDTLQNFMEDVYILLGANNRRIVGGYMHGRPSKNNGEAIVDVFNTPLRFTFEGDQCRVVSAGPDRIFGTEDDVSSDTARDRYTPATLADARAAAEEDARIRAEKEQNRAAGKSGAKKPASASVAEEEATEG